MSRFHSKDELKLEQHAASAATAASPSPPSRRGSRGDSPRLTPNRIFNTHLGSIIKNKEKEREAKNRAAHSITPLHEVKVEEETDDTDPTHTNLHLLEERQEPSGAECDGDSFDSAKDEIRIHVTTEVHLIPLPGEEPSAELLGDTTLDEDDVSNSTEDQVEQTPPQLPSQGSRKKNAMEDLESNLLIHHKSTKSKKRKKSREESPKRSTSAETRKHSSRSRKARHNVPKQEFESPDRNPSPTKRQSRNCAQTDNEIKVKIEKEVQGEVNDQQWNRSASLTSKQDVADSFTTPRKGHVKTGRTNSQGRRISPEPLYSSSSYSTPVKDGPFYTLQNLNPLSKMSSSENYVDVDVSSASDDEIIDHKIFTVRDHHRSLSASAMSSRSGSGCSKPSSSDDFIPFCAPRTAFVPMSHMRQDMDIYCTPPAAGSPYSGSPYATNWQHPYDPIYQQYSGTPPPAMHQGVFQWQGQSDSDAIASLVKFPPPPHPARPLFSYGTPPPGTAEYPTKRFSLPSEAQLKPLNRYSLSPRLLVSTEASTESPPPPAPVVDKRFSCLQTLHHPPKPNIFGYQLIGDSLLVRFAQQILREPPLIAESLRFLGYCVSGQRIGDLLKRLKSGFYHIGNKVILMIGTNDLVKNSQAEQMIYELRRVLEHLCTKAEKIVVLTLPPVPLHEHYTHHWTRLNKYNDFIRTLNNTDLGISVFDISPLYLLSKEELEEEELLAEFNSESPFCRGCLTCMEEVEDFSDSSWSDEDDIMETDLLTSVIVSTSSSYVSHLDICKLFVDKRISRCRMDCFELKYSESSNRKDLIHLNRKGLMLVREELSRLI